MQETIIYEGVRANGRGAEGGDTDRVNRMGGVLRLEQAVVERAANEEARITTGAYQRRTSIGDREGVPRKVE